MARVRHVGSLASVASVTAALAALLGPVSAHAVGLGSGISNLAPVASVGLDEGLNWNPGNDSWKWDGDSKWKDKHDKDQKDVPEPGTFGLYLSALLGGAFYLRTRKSRSR